jgi:hypothetical protein
MGQIVRRNCTLKETARERANEQERERDDLSLLPNIRIVSAEGWMN